MNKTASAALATSPASATTALITARNVSRRFGETRALTDFSLELQPGEVVSLLGGNGAGKTTFLELCLGFTARDGGRLEVLGGDPGVDASRIRAQAAFLPEQFALYESLTGEETLAYFRALAGLPPAEASELRRRLDEAGLDATASVRRVSEYSKGMRQRLALAAALARGVRLLLLDEPTTGLDPGAVSALADLLRAAVSGGGGVLLSTHDLAFAGRVSDRVIFMRQGRSPGKATLHADSDLALEYARAMSETAA